MEVLGKLCTLEGNDEVIEAGLEREAYQSLIKVLIVNDVQVVSSNWLIQLYNEVKAVYIPLTNRVWGPYCKLKRGEKRGFVTYSTDRENEVSKMFIISLRLIGHSGKESFKFSRPYRRIWPTKLTNHSAHTNSFRFFFFFFHIYRYM